MPQDLNFSFPHGKRPFSNEIMIVLDFPWSLNKFLPDDENWGPTTHGLSQTWNTSMKPRATLNFWLIAASTKANEIFRKPSSVFPVGFLSVRGEDEICLSVDSGNMAAMSFRALRGRRGGADYATVLPLWRHGEHGVQDGVHGPAWVFGTVKQRGKSNARIQSSLKERAPVPAAVLWFKSHPPKSTWNLPYFPPIWFGSCFQSVLRTLNSEMFLHSKMMHLPFMTSTKQGLKHMWALLPSYPWS